MDGCDEGATTRQKLTLVKGSHVWVFAWSPGDEEALLRALAALAENESSGFEWFDAAVVSHQMGRRIGKGVYKLSGAGFLSGA